MDLDTTLDAIDEVAVHRCGQCALQLGPEAPSRYWCREICLQLWFRERTDSPAWAVSPLKRDATWQDRYRAPQPDPRRSR